MPDLPGNAIHDYFFQESRKKLFVHDTFGPKVEMPVDFYFRDYKQMPELEKKALKLCKGKTLDIGAAAGSHILELQKNNPEVYALEISPKACEVMKSRKIEHIICEDFFKYEGQQFDTLLLMMNGIGISGNLEGFRDFLKKADSLLNENGQIVFDSCDISYMYEDIPFPENYYYGEVQCRYEYSGALTDWFRWLYLDKNTMKSIVESENWRAEIVFEDENNQYLAVLSRNSEL